MINELVVNSLKHAFPGGRTGVITISLDKLDHRQLKLIFADNGVGFPPMVTFPDSKSLGLQLIQSLAEQLTGEIAFLTNAQGTVFNINLHEL